jgi:hypothetical protein
MTHRLLQIALALVAITTASEAAHTRADDDPILRYAPDGADCFYVADFAGMYAGPAAAAFFKRHPDLEAKLDEPLPIFGVAPRALKQGFVVGKMATESFITVGRLDANVTAAQAFPGSAPGAAIAGLESRRLNIPGHSGVVVDGHTTVRGPTETLRAVLDRKGPARISDQMLALRRAVPNGREIWFVVESSPAAVVGHLVPGKLPDNARHYLAKIKWAVATVDFEERLVFRASVECVDAATVHQLAQEITTAFHKAEIDSKTPAALVESWKKFQATPDGTNLAMRLDLDVETILDLIPRRLLEPDEK